MGLLFVHFCINKNVLKFDLQIIYKSYFNTFIPVSSVVTQSLNVNHSLVMTQSLYVAATQPRLSRDSVVESTLLIFYRVDSAVGSGSNGWQHYYQYKERKGQLLKQGRVGGRKVGRDATRRRKGIEVSSPNKSKESPYLSPCFSDCLLRHNQNQ